jgi:hypothetical protein
MEVYAVAENIGISYLFFYNSSKAEESVHPASQPRTAKPSASPWVVHGWANRRDVSQYYQHEFLDLAQSWQFAHDIRFYLVKKPDLIE